MFSKKGQAIQVLLVIIVVALMLISYIVVIFQVQELQLDDRNLRGHQAINSLFHFNCFSDTYAFINLNEFNSEKFSDCLLEDDEVLMRLSLLGVSEPIYRSSQEQSSFELREPFCSSRSNILCLELLIPVIVVFSDIEQNHTLLQIEVIII